MSFASALANTPLPWQWYYFRARFRALHHNLGLTPNQVEDGETSYRGVTACLNAHYYGHSDEWANAQLGGSWRKHLRVRPPRDIDLLFVLPFSVFQRFENYIALRQSSLLQEVKGALEKKYSRTTMRGDGQVVVVPFDHVTVEVVPAFLLNNARLLICDTKNGGRYKETDIAAEVGALDWADAAYNGCARFLIRMMKQWQRHCNVPIQSFMLERLVLEFLSVADALHIDHQWLDWLARDFWGYIQSRANGYVTMPGTGKTVALGDAWLSRAITARARAVRACDYERDNEDISAGSEWQQIFGTMIPMMAGV